jgi:hypothetical protein
MKKITIFKFILKVFIVATFFSERFLYYKEFKADESIVKSIHHDIVKGWEIDFGKLDKKFSNHQLFKLPYASKFVGELESFLMHHTNLNQTVSHTHHRHASDSVHVYSNKVIDVDSKFKFNFLTAYDILVVTLLLFTVIQESKLAGLLYFLDIALKIYALFYDPTFNHQLVHLFTGQLDKFLLFLLNEKSDLLKAVNFLSTFVYLMIDFMVRKKRDIVVDEEIRSEIIKHIHPSKEEVKKSIPEGKNEENNLDVDGHNYSVKPVEPVPLQSLKRERIRWKSPGGRSKIIEKH